MSETPAHASVTAGGSQEQVGQIDVKAAGPAFRIVVRCGGTSVTVTSSQDDGGVSAGGNSTRQLRSRLWLRLRSAGGLVVGASTVVATVIAVWAYLR
jgi:hypothetical protein